MYELHTDKFDVKKSSCPDVWQNYSVHFSTENKNSLKFPTWYSIVCGTCNVLVNLFAIFGYVRIIQHNGMWKGDQNVVTRKYQEDEYGNHTNVESEEGERRVLLHKKTTSKSILLCLSLISLAALELLDSVTGILKIVTSWDKSNIWGHFCPQKLKCSQMLLSAEKKSRPQKLLCPQMLKCPQMLLSRIL